MNGIRILCDTNPLIYLLSGSAIAAEYLDGKEIWISTITELELFGKKKLTLPELREINSLLSECFITDLNAEIKKLTKELLQESPLKLPDAIIAATSIYLDIPLFTADSAF